MPRRTAADELVPGHIGTIYQASKAEYLGRTTPRRVPLLPDGRVLSERVLSRGQLSLLWGGVALCGPCPGLLVVLPGGL